jgi:hypothetical protein
MTLVHNSRKDPEQKHHSTLSTTHSPKPQLANEAAVKQEAETADSRQQTAVVPM